MIVHSCVNDLRERSGNTALEELILGLARTKPIVGLGNYSKGCLFPKLFSRSNFSIWT